MYVPIVQDGIWRQDIQYDPNNNDSRAAVDPLGYPQAKIHGQMLLFLFTKVLIVEHLAKNNTEY